MLDSLRGIKKWQRLNLQSVIEFKRGREDLSEDLMRQALREPEVKPSSIGISLVCWLSKAQNARSLTVCQNCVRRGQKGPKSSAIYLNCLLDLGKAETVLEETKILNEFPEDKVVLVSRASALEVV